MRVPKIGDKLTIEQININYPIVRDNSLKIEDSGETDTNGNKLYTIKLK